MESSGKENFGSSKGDGDRLSYHTDSIPSEWRFSGDLSNSSFNFMHADTSIPVYGGAPVELSSCASVSMVDSFCATIWDSHNHLSQTPVHLSSGSSQNSEMVASEVGKDVLVLGERMNNGEDPTNKIEQKLANLLKSSVSGNTEDGKQRVGSSSNDSDGAEVSGCGRDGSLHMENVVNQPPSKGLSAKKKRKTAQEWLCMELCCTLLRPLCLKFVGH